MNNLKPGWKTNCDGCGEKIPASGATLRAEHAYHHCHCGTTTYVNPDKTYAEYQCGDCGNCRTSIHPQECENCGSHLINMRFVRWVPVSEIEQAEPQP